MKLDENCMKIQVPKIQDLLERDPYLKLHEWEIRRRYGMFQELVQRIEANEGSLEQFTRGYESFGVLVQPDNSVLCREWAPHAQAMALKGDF
ncbi:unnamed protein product, partial [Cyprideis torosa]